MTSPDADSAAIDWLGVVWYLAFLAAIILLIVEWNP
jgi:hypothetical protein